MSEPSIHEVTRLLVAWNGGDPQALEQLPAITGAFITRCQPAKPTFTCWRSKN